MVTNRYTGRRFTAAGARYTLGNGIAGGGEGEVYLIRGHADIVAKIYHDASFQESDPRKSRAFKERKLKAMLKMKIDPYGQSHDSLHVAWPLAILYSGKTMVGYIMPRVQTGYNIKDFTFRTPGSFLYGKATWRHAVAVAYNLAWNVRYLHERGIVIGDLNPKNILIKTDGTVTLIDADSFAVTDPDTREFFPCEVGLAPYLAPEIQATGGLLASAPFSRESDNFSLAIHLFSLLMQGYHPFQSYVTDNDISSTSSITPDSEILQGNCPYVRTVAGRAIPKHAPKLTALPGKLQDCFRATFHYTALTIRRSIPNRTTARQWRDALLETYQQPMHICSRDATHLFPAHNAVCPWCRAGRPKGVSVAPNPTRGPNRPGSAAGGYAPLRTREPLLIAGMVLGAAGGLLFSLLMQPVLSAGCSDPSLIPAGIIGTMPDFGALSLSPALPATLAGIFAGGWQARQLSRKSARHPLSGSLLLSLLELVLFLVGVPLAAIWLGGITATVLFCVYALFLLVSLITISVNAFRAAAS